MGDINKLNELIPNTANEINGYVGKFIHSRAQNIYRVARAKDFARA